MRDHPEELRLTRAGALALPRATGARWIGEGRAMANRRFWLPSFAAEAPAVPAVAPAAHAVPARGPLFPDEMELWSELDTRESTTGADGVQESEYFLSKELIDTDVPMKFL
eukprot:7063317-Alexandrium_andersonii.AAC.1